jgi:hypothetical protein
VVLFLLLADAFVPIRVSYADVVLCLPLALLLPALTRRAYRPFFVLIVAAFLLSVVPVGGPSTLEYWVMANTARSCAVLAVCIFYVGVRPAAAARVRRRRGARAEGGPSL